MSSPSSSARSPAVILLGGMKELRNPECRPIHLPTRCETANSDSKCLAYSTTQGRNDKDSVMISSLHISSAPRLSAQLRHTRPPITSSPINPEQDLCISGHGVVLTFLSAQPMSIHPYSMCLGSYIIWREDGFHLSPPFQTSRLTQLYSRPGGPVVQLHLRIL